jgi:hypothetical protein
MASTLGLDEQIPYASPTFKLYPNPAHESIEIENYSNAKEALLCDPSGKVLQQVILQDTQTTNFVVSHLTPGIYLIRVGEETRSLVIE